MADKRDGAGARFVRALEDLVNCERPDRATLAVLRRGLSREAGMATEMFPFVVPYLPPHAPVERTRPFFLIASLFALHPTASGPHVGDFGVSAARLARPAPVDPAAEQGTQDRNPGVERRFVSLLDANVDDLPDHLRGLITMMKARETPVDYESLLEDIQTWGHDSRFVQRRWARSFWAVRETSPSIVLETDHSDGTPESEGRESK